MKPKVERISKIPSHQASAVDLSPNAKPPWPRMKKARQLNTYFIDVRSEAIKQGLQTKVVKLQIPVGFERGTQPVQIELASFFFVEQLCVYAFL
jgi:hypothetical protein